MQYSSEIRVRPVTRYVVTRFYSYELEDGAVGGGHETLAEVDHEAFAHELAEAIRANPEPHKQRLAKPPEPLPV